MNTKVIRELFNVTQKDLSEMFKIPLGTIKNWDARNCMPEYMENIIIMYFSKCEDVYYLKFQLSNKSYK